MRYFYIFLVSTLVNANSFVDSLTNNILRTEEQKKVYNKQKEIQDINKSLYIDTQLIKKRDKKSSKICINIRDISLANNHILDKKELEKVFTSHIDKCNTLDEINNIIIAINNLYIKHGYITSRAYLKPQKLSTGFLKISAMEGKIEDIKDVNINSSLIIIANIKDRYFQLREIEGYIEQLNRLKSKKVTIDVKPGDKVGYSKLILKGKDLGYPIKGYIGTDNYSYGNFKKAQLNTTITWENPLGVNDSLKVSSNISRKDSKDNSAIGYGISYGLPILSGYIELGYNKFKYSNMIDGLNKQYLSEGYTKDYYIKADYTVMRTKNQKAIVSTNYTHSVSRNYLDSTLLDTTSKTVDSIKLSYTHKYFFENFDISAMIGFKKTFNGKYINSKEADNSDLIYKKIIFSLATNVKLKGGKYPISLKSSMYGQYADKNSTASAYIGIGGPYSVRGFKNSEQLSSYTGFYIRNDLLLNYKVDKDFLITPYLGLDFGWAKRAKYTNGGSVASVAIGSKVYYKGLELDIFAAKPFYTSNSTTILENGDIVKKRYNGFVGISLGYSF